MVSIVLFLLQAMPSGSLLRYLHAQGEPDGISARHQLPSGGLTMGAKRKAIWVDPDLLALLEVARDRLSAQLGFQPTLSQTLRHLLTKPGED
jgi:hypothetical protein